VVLDRYIARAVSVGSLLACFVMLSIFAFVDFVSQLNSVGTGDYGALQAAIFVLMRLPQRLYDLSPSILLLGGILSLGAMAANSELIVMRASGISSSIRARCRCWILLMAGHDWLVLKPIMAVRWSVTR